MSEWISLEDKKPENGQDVLLHLVLQRNYDGSFSEYDAITTGCWQYGESGSEWVLGSQYIAWDYDFNLGITEDDIAHWMPLPEPPKE
jgi:hypothetical protein